MDSATDKRCYEITGYWPPVHSEPDASGHKKILKSGHHVGAFVIAASAGHACRIVEAKYPGVRIDQVLHKGYRELLQDLGEELRNAGQ